jgi:hypothetical protein
MNYVIKINFTSFYLFLKTGVLTQDLTYKPLPVLFLLFKICLLEHLKLQIGSQTW